jgi:fatty acid synthase subunit alpha
MVCWRASHSSRRLDTHAASRIETQNGFLETTSAPQRYIEVGPSTVLAAMAKKTTIQKFGLAKDSWWTDREFLSYTDHKESIHYEYKPGTEATDPGIEDRLQPPTSPPGPEPRSMPEELLPMDRRDDRQSSPSTLDIDVPLTALNFVLSLTAQKLKQPFDVVPTHKSIRDLSRG